MFNGLAYTAAGERIVLIDGFEFTESRLREALKWIEAQPKHDWKAGDIFRYKASGNIWRISELIGANGCRVQLLWCNYNKEVGDGGVAQSYPLTLPDHQMVRLVEEAS